MRGDTHGREQSGHVAAAGRKVAVDVLAHKKKGRKKRQQFYLWKLGELASLVLNVVVVVPKAYGVAAVYLLGDKASVEILVLLHLDLDLPWGWVLEAVCHKDAVPDERIPALGAFENATIEDVVVLAPHRVAVELEGQKMQMGVVLGAVGKVLDIASHGILVVFTKP